MFNYMPMTTFMTTLMLGTMITFSSSSWMSMWLGLEINLMSFIPIISLSQNNQQSTESTLKYFLIQAIASNIFMFSSIYYFYQFNSLLLMTIPQYMTILTLTLKLGIAPLHSWFPLVMNNLSWTNCIILMTWQKLAPLYIMSLLNFNYSFIILAFLSAMIGSINGINQNLLRKLMAFSSITHMSWMLILFTMNDPMWMIYMLAYSILSASTSLLFMMSKTMHTNQLISSMNNMPKQHKALIFISILSLGGLPPLLGFFPKWMALNIIKPNMLIIATLILSSLITLYFYLRMTVSSFSLTSNPLKWIMKNNNFKMFNTNNYLIIFSNTVMIPLTYYLTAMAQ